MARITHRLRVVGKLDPFGRAALHHPRLGIVRVHMFPIGSLESLQRLFDAGPQLGLVLQLLRKTIIDLAAAFFGRRDLLLQLLDLLVHRCQNLGQILSMPSRPL